MAKKYISKVNIRPSINNKPIFIPAGTEFEGKLIDKQSLDQMLKAGILTEVKEAAQTAPPASIVEPVVEPIVIEPIVEPVVTEPAAAAPQGIWNCKRKGIEKLHIDVLNALYKEKASDAGLVVTPIEDKEELLTILCSENGEKAKQG